MTPPQAPAGWAYSHDGKALLRQFKFDSYLDGMEACRKIALMAEELKHHPDLLLGHKTLKVTWTTHSEGGVSEKDLQAAKQTDELLG